MPHASSLEFQNQLWKDIITAQTSMQMEPKVSADNENMLQMT